MASVARPRRPTAVIILGICQLVVGGVGLVFDGYKVGESALYLSSPKLMKAVADANPVVGFQMQAPYFLETMTAAASFGFILSIILIADGIGLLMVRRWAYNLGVLYGWLSIVYQVAWLAYVFMIVMPTIWPALDNMVVPAGVQQSPQPYRDLQKAQLLVGEGLVALGLAYPIFVLVMLAVTRNAFRRPRKAAVEAQDYAMDAAAVADGGLAESPPGRGREPDDRIGPARS